MVCLFDIHGCVLKCQICRDNIVSPNNSNEKNRKELPEMDYMTKIVKILDGLSPENQKLFIEFVDALEIQDIQYIKELLLSAHPTYETVS